MVYANVDRAVIDFDETSVLCLVTVEKFDRAIRWIAMICWVQLVIIGFLGLELDMDSWIHKSIALTSRKLNASKKFVEL